MLVKQNQSAALGCCGEDGGGLFGPPFLGPARTRLADLAPVYADKPYPRRAPRQPLEVTIEHETFRPRLQFADANHYEAHRSDIGRLALGRLARPIGAPHLLKVIKPADIWTEDVHDCILRVEQHPI